MDDGKTTQNVRSAFQRQYRESQHKEFLKKEKEREKSTLPQGSRKINGKIYTYHKTFNMKSDAETEAKELKSTNFVRIEREKKGWSIYLLPFP